jgi:hypothetical protein
MSSAVAKVQQEEWRTLPRDRHARALRIHANAKGLLFVAKNKLKPGSFEYDSLQMHKRMLSPVKTFDKGNARLHVYADARCRVQLQAAPSDLQSKR